MIFARADAQLSVAVRAERVKRAIGERERMKLAARDRAHHRVHKRNYERRRRERLRARAASELAEIIGAKRV